MKLLKLFLILTSMCFPLISSGSAEEDVYLKKAYVYWEDQLEVFNLDEFLIRLLKESIPSLDLIFSQCDGGWNVLYFSPNDFYDYVKITELLKDTEKEELEFEEYLLRSMEEGHFGNFLPVIRTNTVSPLSNLNHQNWRFVDLGFPGIEERSKLGKFSFFLSIEKVLKYTPEFQ